MARLEYTIRLSDSAQEFMALALDLVREVIEADEALVTDEIREAAERIMELVEDRRGEL